MILEATTTTTMTIIIYPRHKSVEQQTQTLRGHAYKVQAAAMNLNFPGSLVGEEGPEFQGGKEGQRADREGTTGASASLPPHVHY